MATHWILLADAGCARILESDEGYEDLRVITEMDHVRSHMKGSEVHTDGAGRRGSHLAPLSGLDTKQTLRDEEARRFAKDLCKVLATGLDERRYDHLVVAAAPRFLGALRQQLAQRVAERMLHSVSRDLVHESVRTLPDHLRRIAPTGPNAGLDLRT